MVSQFRTDGFHFAGTAVLPHRNIHNTYEIIQFLLGQHWLDKYSDYESRKETIERAYNFKRKSFIKEGNEGLNKFAIYKDDEYDSVDEIDEEFDCKLENLVEDFEELTIREQNLEMTVI